MRGNNRIMKTYMTVLRAMLMLATISLLVMGALFSYQHWAGSKRLLLIGLLLFIIMVGDHYLAKGSFLKRKSDLGDKD